MRPDSTGLAFLASTMPIVTGSVDRLDQVPGRLSFLFDYSVDAALEDPRIREEMNADASGAVLAALAAELAAAPRLDRGRFRAVADRVKARTGHKGRSLFHPIRVALTGRREGPELDLAVPAIDRGADLPSSAGIPPILGCRERAQTFARALEQRL
jgi:glutamyl/glutaminyl-tRNA synthetase